MTSKLKTDVLETVSGSGTIALTNQLSGMTSASVPALTSAHMPVGSVLQVLFNKYTTAWATSSTGWVNTGLQITITPNSVNSTVLVDWRQHVYFATSTSVWEGFRFRLLRDGVAIWTDNYGIAHAQYQGNTMDKRGDCFLDSPNTTSTVTYIVQLAPTSTETHTFNHGSAASQIIATEIAG